MVNTRNMKQSSLYKTAQKIYHSYLAKKSLHESRFLRNEVLPLLNNDLLKLKLKELDEIAAETGTKTYYVISRENSSIGLLTYVSLFLGHLAYAAAKGFLPVIDIQNTSSLYLEDDQIGKVNAWEFYFQQPYETTLNQVLSTQNYILGATKMQPLSPFISSVFDEQESLFWKILYQHFIRFNEKTKSYTDDEYNNLLAGKRVLGLLYRGTDYTKMRPHGHPIQPTLEEFADRIVTMTAESGDYDCYYLATESRESSDFLKNRFPGKIVENKKVYYDDAGVDYLYQATFDRENDKYLKGLEYLSSIHLLSKCDSFIGGLCAGTYAANFMKEGDYEHKHFFNLGVY